MQLGREILTMQCISLQQFNIFPPDALHQSSLGNKKCQDGLEMRLLKDTKRNSTWLWYVTCDYCISWFWQNLCSSYPHDCVFCWQEVGGGGMQNASSGKAHRFWVRSHAYYLLARLSQDNAVFRSYFIWITLTACHYLSYKYWRGLLNPSYRYVGTRKAFFKMEENKQAWPNCSSSILQIICGASES